MNILSALKREEKKLAREAKRIERQMTSLQAATKVPSTVEEKERAVIFLPPRVGRWRHRNARDGHAKRQEKLGGADLKDAVLWKANLKGASLNDADLSKAELFDVDLTDAELAGANLTGAWLHVEQLESATGDSNFGD